MKLFILFEAIRPHQWIKNLSLFSAAILTGQLTNPKSLINSFIAFIVFCLLSSSSYLINDIIDAENDRNHPIKKNRPIARGDISSSAAISLSIIFLLSGLSLAVFINSNFFFLSLFFIFLQYSYSLVLKKRAILDIVGIAFFFIIRAFAGEVATGYHLPVWIMLTVIFLSLFIASGKRRSELYTGSVNSRKALEGYSKALLNFYTSMFGVCTLVSYALFTFFEERISFDGGIHRFLLTNFPSLLDRKWYMITLLPVILGIMRYGQIIFETQEGERPEKALTTDIPLLISITLWGLLMVTIIYAL